MRVVNIYDKPDTRLVVIWLEGSVLRDLISRWMASVTACLEQIFILVGSYFKIIIFLLIEIKRLEIVVI